MFSRAGRDSRSQQLRQNGPVSPLQDSFDLKFHSSATAPGPPCSPLLDTSPRPREGRPGVADGRPTSSYFSINPPVLPPIPRIASNRGLASQADEDQPEEDDTFSLSFFPPRTNLQDDFNAPSVNSSKSGSRTMLNFGYHSDPMQASQLNGDGDLQARSRADSDTVGANSPAIAQSPHFGIDQKSNGHVEMTGQASVSADHTLVNGGAPKAVGSQDSNQESTRPETARDTTNSRDFLPNREVDSAFTSLADFTLGLPKMEASMFPPLKSPSSSSSLSAPPQRALPDAPAMSRSFIDSRDKPYGQPPKRMQGLQTSLSPPSPLPISMVQPAQSSRSSQSSPTMSGSPRQPISSSSSVTYTSHAQRPPSASASKLSGSTARSPTLSSPSPTASTIGTPFESTSSAFPLPQLVTTRPRTGGATSNVAGVQVPTHHTSGLRNGDTTAPANKAEKRRTRLMNPISLLNRRRSTAHELTAVVDDEERRPQLPNQIKHKSVLPGTINQIPEDFDPRIKGKIVHDFSAPRQFRQNLPRTDSYRDSTSSQAFNPVGINERPVQHFQQPAQHMKGLSSESGSSQSRKPIFLEHFADHQANTHKQGAASGGVGAENRENKDFLTRFSQQSTASTYSQESAILPPFARRSQVLDAAQTNFWRDDDGSWSSGRDSSGLSSASPPPGDRESGVTVFSTASPVTGRSSGSMQSPGIGIFMGSDPAAVDIRGNLSPISPYFDRKVDTTDRPVSEVSRLSTMSDATRPRSQSESTARPLSTVLPAHDIEPVPEVETPVNTTPSMAIPDPRQDYLPTLAPPADHSRAHSSPGMPSPPLESRASATSEPALAETTASASPYSPPRLVQKRASAVGHAKRESDGMGHRKSTASRFSFQMAADSAEEERALEEKFRVVSGEVFFPAKSPGVSAGDEDDDDYFDEDAMNDPDEMEVELQGVLQETSPKTIQLQDQAPEEPTPVPNSSVVESHSSPLTYRGSQEQDYDESIYQEYEIPWVMNERELTYAEHPAFRSHSALADSRRTSYQSTVLDSYLAMSPVDSVPPDDMAFNRSQGSSSTPSGGSPSTARNSSESTRGRNRSGSKSSTTSKASLYLQPHATTFGYAMSPLLEQSEAASPAISPLLGLEEPSDHQLKSDVESSLEHTPVLGAVEPTASIPPTFSVEAPTITNDATALRVDTSNAFSGFHFTDSPDESRHESQHQSRGESPARTRERADSETETRPRWSRTANLWRKIDPDLQETPAQAQSLAPAPQSAKPSVRKAAHRPIQKPVLKHFVVPPPAARKPKETYKPAGGQGPRPRSPAVQVRLPKGAAPHRPARSPSGKEQDEMYFDDGRFDQDKNTVTKDHIDEDVFDLPDFPLIAQPRAAPNLPPNGHVLHVTGMGSSGPYPTFAIPNAALAQQRDSALLLEDIPLAAGPADPKLIPQRNPSEDAKRLGLSTQVPPLPVVEGGESEKRMKRSLQAYHQALADAANRAAAEGRFARQPSVTNPKGDLNVEDEFPGVQPGKSSGVIEPNKNLANMAAAAMPAQFPQLYHVGNTAPGIPVAKVNYTPGKLGFDFGFDSMETGDEQWESSLDEEDDIVAAANAEALANDTDGFYGSEFGFYANARPGSGGEAYAINGGFFGEDGDDGLTRKRSTKEPDLTPITERSEFSTRSSFIGLGAFSGAASGAVGSSSLSSPALARMPVNPLNENEILSFEQLRKLRQNTFGGSNGSRSPSQHRSSPTNQYFATGGTPMAFAYSTESSASSERVVMQDSPQRVTTGSWQQDSPRSTASSAKVLLGATDGSPDLNGNTPRKSTGPQQELLSARKTTAQTPSPALSATNAVQGHSRKGSGADSVTYVREQQEDGQPRWVLERRRTSEHGQIELIGKEVVRGGWI